MTVTLDRNRPFGSVTPPEKGASFHQDGFYFDHHGALIEALLDGEARKRLASLSAKKDKQKEQSRAASNPPANQAKESAQGENKTEGDNETPMKKFVVVVDGKMIDLALFAQDKIIGPKPNWVALQKAIKSELDWDIDSKLSLIGRLAEEGAMNVEDGAIADRDKEED